jgi:hypothetical protein
LFVSAQSFPVQLIPQASPPPPIYFSQYADASTTNSPLRLQIVLNDLEISNREIRLKAYFQGNGISFQSNDVVVGSSPLFLEGGIPLVLTNAELAPYFRFENITGISPNVYGQAIPEGAYQFCFEVYDVLTGNRLSQKSCAISVVFQNEPPFLISPRNKSLVAENNPQNIIFQWTPRSINVSNVEYELSLVEIWDTQIDPQAAFLSSPPVFQTTTTSTTYVYGPADPLILSGKNYAWRVQAKAKQGAEDIGLFKNQGYSEIFSFSYAGSCDLPLGISHEVKGSTNANIFWDDFSTDIPEYTVRYRQKSPSTSAPLSDQAWFMNKTTTNQTTLWDLKAGTTYEYQLQKKCTVAGSEWSIAKQFTTFIADNEASVYQCGITPNFSLTNKEPLPKINTGETFVAGDFPINVLEVSGTNGRFTGKGYVTIPYLNSIRVGVKFTNVLINTDKQMSEGTVVTVYDPTLASILDVDEVVETVDTISDLVAEPFEGDNDLDEMRVNFIIPRDSIGKYIEIKDGMVTITNPVNGASISEPLGDDKVVVDGEGQVYHIDASGEIRDGGQIDSGGAVTSNNVEGISTNGQLEQLTAKDIQITFKEVPGNYGFDEIPSQANANIKKEYTTIPDADGNDYTLVHQAVQKNDTSFIDAVIKQTGDNPYPLDSIVFKTSQGEKIEWSKLDNNTLRLTLKGNYTFENETIYAVVPSRTDSTKQLTAGALTLWHMTDRPVDVVLVSVNGGNVNGLATEVAKIFKKGVTTLNIETQTAESDLDPVVLGDNGLLDIGESGWLTNYNAEQKAVIADLKNKIDYNTNNYYVFVFGSSIAPTKPIGGFMPLQRQFGFVFTSSDNQNAKEEGKGELAKTIAHEIGHGVFALQHPFDLYGEDIKGTTDWLMDYANGSLLSHMDWKQLHNPELKFYVFQDEEDGEIAGRIWFTPDWKPFSINNSSIIRAKEKSDRVKGTVPGFRLNNDVAYDAKYSTNGHFEGYFTEGNSNPYVLKLIPDIQNNSSVYLFESVPNNCANTYLTNYGYVNSNKNSLDFSTANTNISSVNISTNCDKDLCEKGQQFYDDHKKLIKNESILEEDSLKGIAQLICAEGKDAVDYDILIAQLSKDSNQVRSRFWWGRDKHLYDLARDKFWTRPDALEVYLYALKTFQNKISELNSLLNQQDAVLEEYYSAIYYLNDDFLQSLSVQDKIKVVKYILEKDTYITSTIFGFGQNEEHLLLKVVKAVGFDQKEAYDFLEELSNTELFDKLRSGLDDHLGENNFTEFIQHLAKLSEVAYANGDSTTKEPKYTFDWGIKNVDIILSWVNTMGDYDFGYSENQVWIQGLCSSSSVDNGMGGVGVDRQCLVDDKLHPFRDFVQITIIESASLLPELCNNQQAQFCGKAIIVPAIFLEYLNIKKEVQQLENLAFNVITVAGVVLTGGELAAARAGSAAWYWAASDLVYTFSDPIAQRFKGELAESTSDEFAEYAYTLWDGMGLVFQVKGAYDLTQIHKDAFAKGIAAKNVIGEDQFYNALENSIRKNNPGLSGDEVEKIIEDAKNTLGQIESELPIELLDQEVANARRILDKLASAAEDWTTYIGKPINQLAQPPSGYQFYHRYGRKWIRREKANDLNSPQLTVKDGSIIEYTGETIKSLNSSQIDNLTIDATKNILKKRVIFGKFDQDGISYITEAGDDFTYYHMENWEDIYKLVNESNEEMWKINERFIIEQFSAKKEFYFSHDPSEATNFYRQEVDYIKQVLKVKDFDKVGNYWKAIW